MFVRYNEDVIEEIHRKLEYNDIDGEIYWKAVEPLKTGDKVFNRRVAGNIAGTTKKGKNKNGYKEIHIKGKIISAHKLTWYLYYGVWPDKEIDHIDHDRGNNKISNLRLVDRSTQNRSACRRKDNTSGHTGVYWCKTANKWLSIINYDKKTYQLGRFENIEDAIKARLEAEIKFGFSETHGKQLSIYAEE